MTPSTGAAAEAARAAFRAHLEAKGHAVDNARAAAAGLEAAFAAGDLVRTPALALMLDDLGRALAGRSDAGAGAGSDPRAPAGEATLGGRPVEAKLGGKSAEAARFILRAIDREIDSA